jgi:dTDP-4-amino-4,6-dideoxygalactose transaminase
MGCLSFYVTKNITTGEGGMVIAGELRHEERIKILALHRMTEDAWERFSDEGYKHYHVADAWHKYNMTDLRAALEINQRRRDICERCSRAFCGLPVTVPPPPEPDTRHAYCLFTLLLDLDKLSITRDGFPDEMTCLGIGVGVHCIVLHLHPYYRQKYGYTAGDFICGECVSERAVLLRPSPKLADVEMQDVIDTVTAS